MKTTSVIRGLAYGIEILLSRSSNFKNKNKYDDSLDQRNYDSLYRRDVRHKELESVISEFQLGALLCVKCTVHYTQYALSPSRIHKHITVFISLQIHILRLFPFSHESARE